MQTNFDDLEDALLYQIALENKIDYYITNDLTVIKKLSNSILPILKPKELLKVLSNRYGRYVYHQKHLK